jgi:DNA (cytosine-5)-methyltransferase 1
MRLFTESECKAIQGFPSDFKVPVSRTSMYRQFGNAVAVPVVREVAQRMIHCLDLVSLKDCEIKDN